MLVAQARHEVTVKDRSGGTLLFLENGHEDVAFGTREWMSDTYPIDLLSRAKSQSMDEWVDAAGSEKKKRDFQFVELCFRSQTADYLDPKVAYWGEWHVKDMDGKITCVALSSLGLR